MPAFEYTTVSITGYENRAVPNQFLKQVGQTTTVAVLLPGLRYTSDMPLLYYPARLLTQRGMDVLQLQTDYTLPNFQSASRPDQAEWVARDSLAAVRTCLAQRDYNDLVLIGKSIGTLALAYLVTSEIGAKATTIWLTPLLRNERLVRAAGQCKAPALFVVGTGDPTYVPAALEQIKAATGAQTLLLDDADHSLEIPGDVIQSTRLMERLLLATAEFLDDVL